MQAQTKRAKAKIGHVAVTCTMPGMVRSLQIKTKPDDVCNSVEFLEGVNAAALLKAPWQCPYASFNLRRVSDEEWVELYKPRFDAWMLGFTSNKAPMVKLRLN